MKFRTEIDIRRSANPITHDMPLVTIGSCFSDAIGLRLATDGFDVSVNPMGVLFNPVSIANVLNRALERRQYTVDDLYADSVGTYHCLDFESRRQSTDVDSLLSSINADFVTFANNLVRARRVIVTWGTAWVFDHLPTGRVVGNCHRLPDSEFSRRLISMDDIVQLWQPLCRRLDILLTISPVRHLNDGLHGNTLSKSILHLAADVLAAEYFPAYEALIDDLRDYRFYADDLKHPSTQGEEYIYECFKRAYFDHVTDERATVCRKENQRAAHRPILKQP